MVLSGKERDRLKRQTAIGNSCPMHLVATHSFVSLYGAEDAIQFMVSGSYVAPCNGLNYCLLCVGGYRYK